MTLALCINCTSQKFGALVACDNCGFAPRSQKEIAKSLVYCDQTLSREALEQIELSFKGQPLPDLSPENEEKMAAAAREGQRILGIVDRKKLLASGIKMAMKGLANVLGILAALFGFMGYFGAAAIHIWTVVIAYNTNGLFAAFLTFSLPPLSEIYWFFIAWHNEGTIFNEYDRAVMSLLAVFLLLIPLAIGAAKADGWHKAKSDAGDG